MRHVTVVVVLSALAMFAACSGGPPQAPAPPFAALVDEYLDQFARRHPSIAHACRPTSPPLEPNPVKSYYYITNAQADWPIEQQNGWLQKFNYPTLTDISAHEVVPGHYVHSLFMRRTPGKIRRIWIGLNPFPQPSSGQDGWAHYGEQLVSDEGFKQEDPRYRMAQISEAHLPAAAARQEAVRGTYDPTYGGYFLGKVAAFKLRRDYQAAQGRQFDLRAFHERVMSNGIAPWWAHRQLLLPGDREPVVE